MSDQERQALELHINSLQAEELLRERGGQMQADAMKDLMVAAGASEEDATDAWAKRLLDEMRAGKMDGL